MVPFAVAFATLSWWEGHGFWDSLLGLGDVLVLFMPLMWTRWFPSEADLRSRRGLVMYDLSRNDGGSGARRVPAADGQSLIVRPVRSAITRLALRRFGVSSTMEARAPGNNGVDSRGEAPSMYEMEGASQSHGSNGPIARPANPRNPPPSSGEASANSGRHGARLPRRRLPGWLASGWTLSQTPASKCSLPRTPGAWCSLTLRFPSEPGHHLWWRGKFLSPLKDLRKRLEEPISRFFAMARLIHRSGYVTPRPRRVVHHLSTSSSTHAPTSRLGKP
jgi:hypothetical protein